MWDYPSILRLLDVLYKADSRSDLLWYVKGQHVDFCILCSDVFWWGTADLEEIYPEDLDDLENAFKDCKALEESKEAPYATNYMATLWVARKRKMRPQGACYENMDAKLAELFDKAGEKRELNIANPKDR